MPQCENDPWLSALPSAKARASQRQWWLRLKHASASTRNLAARMEPATVNRYFRRYSFLTLLSSSFVLRENRDGTDTTIARPTGRTARATRVRRRRPCTHTAAHLSKAYHIET